MANLYDDTVERIRALPEEQLKIIAELVEILQRKPAYREEDDPFLSGGLYKGTSTDLSEKAEDVLLSEFGREDHP
jgi:hypothetical protein